MEVKGEANFLHSGLRFNIPFFLVTHIYSHTTHPARQRQTIPDRFTQIGIHQAYETSNSSPPGLGRHRIAQRQLKPATNKKKKEEKRQKKELEPEKPTNTHTYSMGKMHIMIRIMFITPNALAGWALFIVLFCRHSFSAGPEYILIAIRIFIVLAVALFGWGVTINAYDKILFLRLSHSWLSPAPNAERKGWDLIELSSFFFWGCYKGG